MKKLVLLLALIVAVCGLTACGKKEEEENNNPVTIIENGKEENNEKENNNYVGQDDLDPYTANIPNEIIDFYIEKVNAIEKEHKDLLTEQIETNPDFDIASASNLKYDLVFIDDNNTPELVVTNPGYSISLYTYDAGNIMNAFGEEESWAYGAGGNGGYDYAPKKNVIFNTNNDYAGMVKYYNYYKINDNHLIEAIYGDALCELHFEDKDGDRVPAEDDEYKDDPVAFYQGDKALTSEEFNSMIIEADYEELTGKKSADEILRLLNGLVNLK